MALVALVNRVEFLTAKWTRGGGGALAPQLPHVINVFPNPNRYINPRYL